jgi:hypothetical protein
MHSSSPVFTKGMGRSLAAALSGAVLLGAANTLGDFIWAWGNVRHRVLYGVLHGALLLLCLGLYLGWLRGRTAIGALGGVVAGALAAGVFYALAPAIRWGALFAAWGALWIFVGLLDGVVLRRGHARAALSRGALAAAASSIAFFAIAGIWLEPRTGGPRYIVNFLSWTIAFLPGLLVLVTRTPARGDEAGASYHARLGRRG